MYYASQPNFFNKFKYLCTAEHYAEDTLTFSKKVFSTVLHASFIFKH